MPAGPCRRRGTRAARIPRTAGGRPRPRASGRRDRVRRSNYVRRDTPGHTAGAPPHDLLTLTGGAIGQGLPVAVGAALACPGRPVFAFVGDGSAMYTIQSLWTMAREELDVTVVIFNNGSYAILNVELERVGAERGGPRAKSQLDLRRPDLDFVQIASGFGVPAVRVDTGEGLVAQLERAVAEPGPHLIEAVVPSVYTGLKLKTMPYALNALDKLPPPLARAAAERFHP